MLGSLCYYDVFGVGLIFNKEQRQKKKKRKKFTPYNLQCCAILGLFDLQLSIARYCILDARTREIYIREKHASDLDG